MLTTELPDLAALDALAAQLVTTLAPGTVVALEGPMGSGKTTLVQAAARHAGLSERVVSPTFTLIHDYLSGPTPWVHVDAYRLGPDAGDALAPELLPILQAGQSVVWVEWAEWVPFLAPWVTHRLRWEPTGPDEVRHVQFSHRRPTP